MQTASDVGTCLSHPCLTRAIHASTMCQMRLIALPRATSCPAFRMATRRGVSDLHCAVRAIAFGGPPPANGWRCNDAIHWLTLGAALVIGSWWSANFAGLASRSIDATATQQMSSARMHCRYMRKWRDFSLLTERRHDEFTLSPTFSAIAMRWVEPKGKRCFPDSKRSLNWRIVRRCSV